MRGTLGHRLSCFTCASVAVPSLCISNTSRPPPPPEIAQYLPCKFPPPHIPDNCLAMTSAGQTAIIEPRYCSSPCQIFILDNKVKVNQSRYRPGVAQRVPGSYGKSVPLQAWSGPEGSRKLKFPDFMTTAQGGGKVVSLTHRPHLPPENSPGTHFC